MTLILYTSIVCVLDCDMTTIIENLHLIQKLFFQQNFLALAPVDFFSIILSFPHWKPWKYQIYPSRMSVRIHCGHHIFPNHNCSIIYINYLIMKIFKFEWICIISILSSVSAQLSELTLERTSPLILWC